MTKRESNASLLRSQSWTKFGVFKGRCGWSSDPGVGRGQVRPSQIVRVPLAMARDIFD